MHAYIHACKHAHNARARRRPVTFRCNRSPETGFIEGSASASSPAPARNARARRRPVTFRCNRSPETDYIQMNPVALIAQCIGRNRIA